MGGVDIRGYGWWKDFPPAFPNYLGDVIRIVMLSSPSQEPRIGYIWVVAGKEFDQCVDSHGCRLYVIGGTDSDGNQFDPATQDISDVKYIYYYSHLSIDHEHSMLSPEFRESIGNATKAGSANDPANLHYPISSVAPVEAGQILARMTRFKNGNPCPDDDYWDHLHFSIIDAQGNFDVINPLTAFKRNQIWDEVRPYIGSIIRFRLDENNGGNWVNPRGACQEIDGDIVSEMRDAFRVDPDLIGTGQIGVYSVVRIEFRCNHFPMYEEGAQVALNMYYNQEIVDKWQNVPWVEMDIVPSWDPWTIRIRLLKCNLSLPPLSLEPGETIPVNVDSSLPPSWGQYFLDFSEYVETDPGVWAFMGGMTFYEGYPQESPYAGY